MNYFTTELMKNLFANENNLPAFEETVTELFHFQLEKSLNEILTYELTAFLDYERYERSDNLHSRNGSYQHKLDTKYGQHAKYPPKTGWVNSIPLLFPDTEEEISLSKQPFWIYMKKA